MPDKQPPDKPAAVLDTQVLLDWWVFGDARVRPWVAALQDQRIQWLACSAMRAEFERMLRHPQFAARQPPCDEALARFDRLCALHPDPAPGQPGLVCRDRDDQVFIDLALQHRARWLITRDKALLKLARRARALGVEVASPEHALPPS
jgi:putative PIN family toxin of toxin-antitoxin system